MTTVRQTIRDANFNVIVFFAKLPSKLYVNLHVEKTFYFFFYNCLSSRTLKKKKNKPSLVFFYSSNIAGTRHSYLSNTGMYVVNVQ